MGGPFSQQGEDFHDGVVVIGHLALGGLADEFGEGRLWVWRADGTGEPVVLKGHGHQVTSVVFSPDGRHVLTTSYDKTARVWQADGSGEPVPLKGQEATVESDTFSPDGQRIVTASRDRTARVWAITGESLQAAIRSATRMCLDPPFRQRYFGEPPGEALNNYQTCERDHGRSGIGKRAGKDTNISPSP